jgi:Cu-processing system ATP-binding protein
VQPSTDYAIELNAVGKRYENVAVVDGIDLQISAGECFVLVGHNGAGKTTLLKLMLGLTRPSHGQVKVLGEDPASSTFVMQRRVLGYLPESVSFYAHLTGLELMRYYARLKGVATTEVNARLQQVGLDQAANKRLSTYSKGMRQRLGLAQAILGTPQVLFLDEPTNSLDPLLRRDFYNIIGELRAGGTTLVISSHALNEVEAQADRIAIIKQGQLLASGSLPELGELADLPVQIRLHVEAGSGAGIAEQLPANIRVEHISELRLDLLCAPAAKMSLLRHLTSLGETVHDINIATPGLNEIYLHFMNEKKALNEKLP